MLKLFLTKAWRDILANRFLNAVTVITITLSILIVSAFALFFLNANDVLTSWKQGIRMMVYLKADTNEAARMDLTARLEKLPGIRQVAFISREDALALLKLQMKRQSALLEDLDENPLPDAFEVRLDPELGRENKLEPLAHRIETLPQVSDVEYGQQWIGRFTQMLNLFRLAGYGLGSLFFMATVFIMGNTIRLMLYSRQDEIEIMQLVGASDNFIRIPFYIQALLQGLAGGVAGILILFGGYLILATRVEQGFAFGLLSLRFFPLPILLGVVLGSMLVGWLGCFLSLKQFFKSVAPV